MALVLAACTPVRNPATGELQYTSLSPADERQLGRAEHPKALAQFGGAYDNAALSAYVERVGARIKDVSELRGETFTFTVLDSDVVNAFALPGGYVYVTRGLVALTNDEAELAGVLGHEIGHVTARHTAQRYDRAQIGQGRSVAAQLAGLLLGGSAGRLRRVRGSAASSAGRRHRSVPQAYVQGYSREQEFEADQLGIRYLGRRRLRSQRHGELSRDAAAPTTRTASAPGRRNGRGQLSRRLVPHPPAHARSGRPRGRGRPAAMPGARETDRAGAAGGARRDALRRGSGAGRDRWHQLPHPGLRIAFEAPTGFRLQNSPDGRGRRRRPGSVHAVRHGARACAAICAATCSRAG